MEIENTEQEQEQELSEQDSIELSNPELQKWLAVSQENDSLKDPDEFIDQDLPELKDGEHYKGMPPINELLKAVPTSVKMHWKNMEKTVSKKSNEAHEWKTKYEQLQKQMKQSEIEMAQEMRQYVSGLQKQKPDLTDIDYTTDEGWGLLAKSKSIEALEEFFVPKLEQVQKQNQQQQIDHFINSNPEFEDQGFFDFVLNIVETKGYALDDAFEVAKVKYQPEPSEDEKFKQIVKTKNKTMESKQVSRNTLGGIRPNSTPDFTGAKSLADYARAIDPDIDMKIRRETYKGR